MLLFEFSLGLLALTVEFLQLLLFFSLGLLKGVLQGLLGAFGLGELLLFLLSELLVGALLGLPHLLLPSADGLLLLFALVLEALGLLTGAFLGLQPGLLGELGGFALLLFQPLGFGGCLRCLSLSLLPLPLHLFPQPLGLLPLPLGLLLHLLLNPLSLGLLLPNLLLSLFLLPLGLLQSLLHLPLLLDPRLLKLLGLLPLQGQRQLLLLLFLFESELLFGDSFLLFHTGTFGFFELSFLLFELFGESLGLGLFFFVLDSGFLLSFPKVFLPGQSLLFDLLPGLFGLSSRLLLQPLLLSGQFLLILTSSLFGLFGELLLHLALLLGQLLVGLAFELVELPTGLAWVDDGGALTATE